MDKTLGILEALVEHSRIAEIAAATDLPKSTVHRILQTLVERGFARTDGQGSYVGGPRILALAGRYLQRLDLPQRVRPVLEDLQRRTGWTVHLALLSGDEAVYAAKVEGDKPYHLASRVGMDLRLHCTSIGKAILAAMPDDQVREVLRRTGMKARTPNTLRRPAALLAELAEVRRKGYAEDHEENELGVCAVGAAVFDHTGQVTGGVSAAALVHEPAAGTTEWRGEQVIATAAEVSALLGAPRS
ncbi:IclR family transcriptional regulator [Allonocardiopsis opalescens]|uniref:IclR family transcriptional regulator n=1 Tax=Allonocardiopsis opalescens TaxID=1144618 RepID=UPI0014752D2A|nr:IclR family transcriptional regulator [Allonocardiopsis opalescens]